jgi:4-hydroxy-tetrahydrodipicolinate reductase
MSIRLVVVGAAGRMGQTAVHCLTADSRFHIAGLVGRQAETRDGQEIKTDLNQVLDAEKPDALLELTTGQTAANHALAALQRDIPVVIGSTGLSQDDLEAIRKAAKKVACLVVPNFAIGAVLMMRFAEMAAAWLPDVEIIELHHEKKVDAPSGTAMSTAIRINDARTTVPTSLPEPLLKVDGARGAVVQNVPVHSIRLRGLLAHQEVIFGGQGEALTIRHDSLDRSSFEAGILLSCAQVTTLKPGLHIGLDVVM